MKRRLALALDSMLSRVPRSEHKEAKVKPSPVIHDPGGPHQLPGRYLGQAMTLGQRPLTRYYSLVKDPGGAMTFWVYCPELDNHAHEDESVSHVEELVEYCENRGLRLKDIYRQLKRLDQVWARQLKKRSTLLSWV